jgi:hypothetical protein
MAFMTSTPTNSNLGGAGTGPGNPSAYSKGLGEDVAHSKEQLVNEKLFVNWLNGKLSSVIAQHCDEARRERRSCHVLRQVSKNYF